MKHPTEVLILDQYSQMGGGQVVGRQLLHFLADRGVAVQLFVPGEAVAGEVANGLVGGVDLRRRAIVRESKRLSVDLDSDNSWIIVNGPRVFPLAFLIKLQRPRTRLLYYVHNVPGSKWMRRVSSVFSRLSDRTVAVAEFMAPALHNAYVLHNCARPELRLFDSRESAEAIQVKEHGHLSLNVKFMGRHDPVKGVDVLAGALELFDTGLLSFTSITVALADSIHTGLLNIEQSDFPDFVAVVSGKGPIWLQPGDILIVPSRFEASSLVVHEAMARGVVVLASDCAGNVEAMDGAGMLFRNGDASDLARKLELLLTSCHLRSEIAAAGALRALRCTQLWTEYWEEFVLSGPRQDA